MRLAPSLTKCLCFFSFRTKTTSAGIMSFPSSPSLGNVILVPFFHPGLTLIVRSFNSSSNWPFSACRLCVMFLRLTHPLYNSSRVHSRSSVTSGHFCGPCRFKQILHQTCIVLRKQSASIYLTCFFMLLLKGIESPNPNSAKGLSVPKKRSKISFSLLLKE
jgi:hypothetical protein